MVNAGEYIHDYFNASTLFETEYVDPAYTNISFPEDKRNLIYIYMESMETTFYSEEDGGALPDEVIPELYEMADTNLNFSRDDKVGGCRVISGGTWTIGALVSYSAGIPLKLPSDVYGNDYGKYDTFLPGVTSIYDILHENGYTQAFMCGSDSNFAGRRQYFEQHGVDTIYDYNTAIEDEIIPADHNVWWGMEDFYLYDYAKLVLTELAKTDELFSFSMLTVDTHHIGGYYCELCEDTYEEQYENVYACASRQVADFVDWIQQQDFYDDTTIIIVGDHPSMDAEFIERNVDSSYTRQVYNCFINAAITTDHNKNREFSQFDIFPTTLAAIGCDIEGDRLGLGVNLFSEQPTLSEQMGFDEFNAEVKKRSNLYNDSLLTTLRH